MRKDSAGLEEVCRIGRCAEFPIDGHSGCEVRDLRIERIDQKKRNCVAG